MTEIPDNSATLNYFEDTMKNFIVEKLSHIENWWNSCIPQEIRKDASQRHERDKKINDVLNKPNYEVIDYINFDGYEKIILRRDNWRDHFERVFLDKTVFGYKMRVVLSLRNDIRHGRGLDEINNTRLRLHCYDILSQIHESMHDGSYNSDALAEKLGFETQ